MSNPSALLEEVAPPASARVLDGASQRNADFPVWFRGQQAAAWTEFQNLPMPAVKDQAWRFSNVKALDLAPYQISSAALPDEEMRELLDRSTELSETDGRLVFADDHLLARDARLIDVFVAASPVFEKLRSTSVRSASSGCVAGERCS